jgi:tetrahydrodipicolinate N-acetyltransferase
MNAQEIIDYISTSKKKTPVKLYVNTTGFVDFGDAQVFGSSNAPDNDGGSWIVFGDWAALAPILEKNADRITDCVVENDRRNSGVPLLDLKDVNARIEPGAIIREQVEIGDGAVIMMGAIINIGAVVGSGTMIDMGAVLGGRATVGAHCHIGAGAVLAGVVEPASATPVIIEDNVLVGANAVVIEGVHVGEGAVVAAGAVVVEDVPADAVVAGCPARIIKMKDAKTEGKTALIDALRKL